ncbi:MAG TPA: cation transporter [Methylomirabilota bacterium]|nr:cation transporter [Methylomirabilota bacterium]
MRECCEIRSEVPDRQRRVLKTVLAVNAVMFVIELGWGIRGHSTSLVADSVDMLGDAIVYGASLSVLARAVLWQARVALVKGLLMAAFGVGVLVEVATKLERGLAPEAGVMGTVGLLALGANAACLALLWRHRADDLNMRSAFVCSLNDVAGNAGVLLASVGVGLLHSAWPDIAVGLLIAGMFGASAIGVIGKARRQLA